MKFAPVPLSEAKGKILGHNIADADGRRRHCESGSRKISGAALKGKKPTEESIAAATA